MLVTPRATSAGTNATEIMDTLDLQPFVLGSDTVLVDCVDTAVVEVAASVSPVAGPDIISSRLHELSPSFLYPLQVVE